MSKPSVAKAASKHEAKPAAACRGLSPLDLEATFKHVAVLTYTLEGLLNSIEGGVNDDKTLADDVWALFELALTIRGTLSSAYYHVEAAQPAA